MAKVHKVIAGVKGRQEIDKLVIMSAEAKGYFCGKLASWEATPVELIAWKRQIENLEVIAHSTDCGKALMMIVDDKGAI